MTEICHYDLGRVYIYENLAYNIEVELRGMTVRRGPSTASADECGFSFATYVRRARLTATIGSLHAEGYYNGEFLRLVLSNDK